MNGGAFIEQEWNRAVARRRREVECAAVRRTLRDVEVDRAVAADGALILLDVDGCYSFALDLGDGTKADRCAGALAQLINHCLGCES